MSLTEPLSTQRDIEIKNVLCARFWHFYEKERIFTNFFGNSLSVINEKIEMVFLVISMIKNQIAKDYD